MRDQNDNLPVGKLLIVALPLENPWIVAGKGWPKSEVLAPVKPRARQSGETPAETEWLSLKKLHSATTGKWREL